MATTNIKDGSKLSANADCGAASTETVKVKMLPDTSENFARPAFSQTQYIFSFSLLANTKVLIGKTKEVCGCSSS